MRITIDIPDELLQHYNHNNLPREILEALVVRAYQAEKITSAEVGHILGLSSRWVVDAFLKDHDANLHYDEVYLDSDRKTLQQLRAIFRTFLDSTTIRYVIQKYSGYHRKIYGKFLAITLYRVIIPKVSAFCPKGVDYPENVGIINSCSG